MTRPRTAPRAPKLPPPLEHHEQALFFQRVALDPRTRGLLIFACPNGGKRHVVTAVKLKREGVKAGVPDIFVDEPRREYHGCRIEMKRLGGTVTQEQRWWLQMMRERGYYTDICYGAEPAWITLCHYLGITP